MRSSTLRGVVALEVLAFLVTVLGLLHIPDEREYMLIFRVFYFPLIPLAAMLWLWGVNVAIWTQYRTNYLKVFEVEDRVVLPCHDDVFKMAHISTLMILASSAFFSLLRPLRVRDPRDQAGRGALPRHPRPLPPPGRQDLRQAEEVLRFDRL